MQVQEMTHANGMVNQLEISSVTIQEAIDIATRWCEENNCLLNGVTQDGNTFIASVCSDDYS